MSSADGGPDTTTLSRVTSWISNSNTLPECRALGPTNLDPKAQTQAPSPPKTVAGYRCDLSQNGHGGIVVVVAGVVAWFFYSIRTNIARGADLGECLFVDFLQ